MSLSIASAFRLRNKLKERIKRLTESAAMHGRGRKAGRDGREPGWT